MIKKYRIIEHNINCYVKIILFVDNNLFLFQLLRYFIITYIRISLFQFSSKVHIFQIVQVVSTLYKIIP